MIVQDCSTEERAARSHLFGFDERKLGKFGEAVLRNLFASSGLGYISLCDIESGGAPMIQGNSKVVLPDYQVIGRGWSAYIDAKCKTHVVLWRKTNQLRHGILRRNYRDYLATGKATKQNAGVGIVELFEHEQSNRWSGSILVQSFRNLGEPIEGMAGTCLHDTVLWPRKSFCDLLSLTAVELIALANGKYNADSHIELEQIFNPPPPQVQQSLF